MSIRIRSFVDLVYARRMRAANSMYTNMKEEIEKKEEKGESNNLVRPYSCRVGVRRTARWGHRDNV